MEQRRADWFRVRFEHRCGVSGYRRRSFDSAARKSWGCMLYEPDPDPATRAA